MKLLQQIALLASIVLIASCGGSSGGGVAPTPTDPPPDPTGIQGQATKGLIVGGTITVTDATGANIPLSTGDMTDANGTYDALFSTAAVALGIVAPLEVTINGTGATVTCDWDVDGDDDCAVGDGSYASFGSTYALPGGFTLSGFSATAPTTAGAPVTININPATDIASTLALRGSGAALNISDVDVAEAQTLGLVQVLSGVNLSGVTLGQQTLVDLTSLASASLTDANLALSIFGASVLGQIDVDDAALDSITNVIASITDGLVVSGADLQATGTMMSRVSTAVAQGAGIVQAQLQAGGPTHLCHGGQYRQQCDR